VIQAANEPMGDLRGMYMAHTMMRREFRLLPPAVRDVAPGDNRSAAVVADHVQKVCLILGLHHEDEDAVLWPLLWERGAEQAATIVPSMEQHHGIAAALHNVHALVPAWQSTAQDGENLAASIDALLDRLPEHMALEKKEILPLAEKFVTAAEWARLGERALSETPKKDLPLGLGMSHTRRAWPPVWPTPPSRSAVRSGSRSSRPSPTAAPKACSTSASTARPWR
jgi:hemerythrin-like domain-containing protein